MNISLVPIEHATSAWNQVRHYLEPAIERCNGRWSMEHLCAAVTAGNTQLWIAFDDEQAWGAITTEVTRYPAKTMLSMHFLGGENFDAWYGDMLEHLGRYAKEVGCDGLEGVARFGFWKWLKEDGFVKSSIFYERDL